MSLVIISGLCSPCPDFSISLNESSELSLGSKCPHEQRPCPGFLGAVRLHGESSRHLSFLVTLNYPSWIYRPPVLMGLMEVQGAPIRAPLEMGDANMGEMAGLHSALPSHSQPFLYFLLEFHLVNIGLLDFICSFTFFSLFILCSGRSPLFYLMILIWSILF